MKKIVFMVLIGTALFVSCESVGDKFLISEDTIGSLKKGSKASDLENVFIEDSIVRDTTKFKIGGGVASIFIYEKGGKPLLKLSTEKDSTEKINHIQILDVRYQTDRKIGLASTFGEIQKKYEIKKIATTLKSVVIFPKESNLYFTIDKEELPANLRFNQSQIEAVQIPEEAKIKYLMMGWEE